MAYCQKLLQGSVSEVFPTVKSRPMGKTRTLKTPQKKEHRNRKIVTMINFASLSMIPNRKINKNLWLAGLEEVPSYHIHTLSKRHFAFGNYMDDNVGCSKMLWWLGDQHKERTTSSVNRKEYNMYVLYAADACMYVR